MKSKLTLPLAAALAIAASSGAFASEPGLRPSSVFVQGGSWTRLDSATVGLTWDWHWQHEIGRGTLTGYTEVDVGRWRTRGRADDHGFNQFGVTPVLRFYPVGVASGWFADAGIGANAITPMYHNDSRRFSTVFNFGDRIAIGRRFGPDQAHELSVGFEHFSNADIKKPNPGENFIQVRYAYRF